MQTPLSFWPIWVIFTIIGVFDAREYRIPNSMVMLLWAFSIASVVVFVPPHIFLENLGVRVLGTVIFFVTGLLLYVCRVMSAGDVKLLSVVGFLLEIDELLSFVVWMAILSVYIGCFFLLINKKKRELFKLPVKDVNKVLSLTYMPFAPIIIISLAMQQYF